MLAAQSDEVDQGAESLLIDESDFESICELQDEWDAVDSNEDTASTATVAVTRLQHASNGRRPCPNDRIH